jgi:hypothetical protein
MDQELRHLQARYRHLLQLLGHAPADMYQREVHTRPLHAGYPHVELVDGRYHYVVTERGSELQRRAAKDENELLYWLMSDVTHGIAMRLETGRWFRIGDPRRWWFAKDVELLRQLRPEWGERKRAEYEQILLRNPYMDKKATMARGWFR